MVWPVSLLVCRRAIEDDLAAGTAQKGLVAAGGCRLTRGAMGDQRKCHCV